MRKRTRWVENTRNIRIKINKFRRTREILRNKSRKLSKEKKPVRIKRAKLENFTSLFRNLPVRDRKLKMNMRPLWLKEIFWEPNWSEETMNPPYSTRRSKFNRTFWLKARPNIVNVSWIFNCWITRCVISNDKPLSSTIRLNKCQNSVKLITT